MIFIISSTIEQKGKTFDHDFGYFLFPPRKRGEKKRRINSKKQMLCLSARLFGLPRKEIFVGIKLVILLRNKFIDLFEQGSRVKIFISSTIEQKDMTFDHDFGYSLSLFFSLLEKKGIRKEE